MRLLSYFIGLQFFLVGITNYLNASCLYPQNLNVSSTTVGAQLTWTYSGSNPEFIIERVEGESGIFSVLPVSPDSIKKTENGYKFLDTEVSAYQQYTYQIKVLQASCLDYYSDEISLIFAPCLEPEVTHAECVTLHIETPEDYNKGELNTQINTNGIKVFNIAFEYWGLVEGRDYASILNLKKEDNYKIPVLSHKNLAYEQGIGYQFIITDIFGNKCKSAEYKAYLCFSGNGVESPDLHITWEPYRKINIKRGSTSKERNLISVPLEPPSKSIETLLVNKLAETIDTHSSPNGKNWLIYQMPPTRKNILTYPADIENFDFGQSYWVTIRPKKEFMHWLKTGIQGLSIKVKNDPPYKTFRFYSGAGNTSLKPAEIPLQKGWNHIGNPYNFPVDWKQIKLQNPSLNLSDYRGYIPKSGISYNSERLERFGGILLFVHEEEPSTLKIPWQSYQGRDINPPAFGSGRIEEVKLPLDAKNWKVELKLGNLNGNFEFGMNPKAQKSQDDFDRMDIPRFQQETSLFFPHSEYFYPYFASDIVPTDSIYEWDFIIKNTNGIQKISWDNFFFGNNDKQLILHDLENEMRINMRSENEYHFEGMAERKFKIYFGSNTSELLQKIRPQKSIVGNPYPNPAQNQVRIPFTISESQSTKTAKLEIYDLQGQKVYTQIQENLTDGFHQFQWDLRTQNQRVSGSLYLAKIQVDGYVPEIRKLLIMN